MTDFPYENIPAELLDALLENPYESNILVDNQGVIRYISKTSEEFFEPTQLDVVGLKITELNPSSQLIRVLQTGRAEIGRLFVMKGKERVVARIPLRDRNGDIVGAVAKLMFWNPGKIKELVRQVEVLESRLNYYEKELQNIYSSRYTLEGVIGESPLIQEAKQAAIQAAQSDLAVLITGETGTGKEIFAHAIHQLSKRRSHPFVRVNCASIPRELMESELFGYERGAFTGADKKGKPGKFELADKGTIFLDEVGDMPMTMQAKLLRVIQEREVERVGGTKPLLLDFRVIAATNRDLKNLVKAGNFREDLFYRLNIFQIKTPSLRTMREDIPRLAYHFLAANADRRQGGSRKITREAMVCLTAYDWPGNARELRNVMQRANALNLGGPVLMEHLPMEVRDMGESGLPIGYDLRSLSEERTLAERRAIRKALRYTKGNRSQAAKLLGIHRTGLYQKMKQYGIERE